MNAYWFIIKNQDIILSDENQLPSHVDTLSSFFCRQFHLGDVNGHAYYCAELDAASEVPLGFQAVPLKKALALLENLHYGMGVKAYSVIHWDKHHQFCGQCGSRTVHQGKSFERVCERCQMSFFPRISPSIIVLIYRGNELVMARSPHFLPGVYGLIAGFVEVGETLEEAVHREVQEEVGLKIKNVAYVDSQPWPFPDSLMIGFTAEYADGELIIDGQEIEAAGWFPYHTLPGRPSLSMSIASKMLDAFIKRHQK